MIGPLINILIRHKYRPELLGRCLHSITRQTYRNYKVWICCDSDQAFSDAQDKAKQYCSDDIEIFDAIVSPNVPFYWNLYSNQLKERVSEGWFFYLDDDDYLNDAMSLERISTKLTNSNEGVICQMLRRNRPKPPQDYIENKKIVRGKIGAPCLFLHHTQKHIADWPYGKGADCTWIQEVERKIPLKFYPIVVVKTGNNGLKGQ